MPKVVGIKFKSSPKVYYFEAGEHEYQENGGVIVETERGTEYGTVAMLPEDIDQGKIVTPLKPILRIATEKDEATMRKFEAKRPETLRITEEKIQKSGLNMKLVDVEYTFDGSKLIVYFTADGRVDFRDLVRELASAFHVRIELRQIGARDECKMMGGIAPCGRACCCSDHMSDFAHVTIKMAKNQGLSLNPAKISGLCGRLMCCLSYENAHYVETNKKMPKIGSEAETADGKKGTVVSLNQLKETVRLKIEEKDAYTFADVPLAELKFRPRGGQNQKADPKEEADDEGSEELKNLTD